MGDENTTYFHRSIKLRRYRQNVVAVQDANGVWCNDTESISRAFVNFYKALLGSAEEHRVEVNTQIVQQGHILNEDHRAALQKAFTPEEVKKALFSISVDRAPSPDGYSSLFFKKAWDIVGAEITQAVLSFMQNARILREINCTTISVIPKVEIPTSVADFRPIACCNVIYKCITKLLSKRLKEVLPDLISPNQTGFVEGRKIFHNISIIQDIIAGYGRKNSPSGCLLKVDIKKAYDSVRWEFLEEMLHAFNFPEHFIKLVMVCVTTPSFSINVNGNLEGFFQGKRELRQGDPMSPLLFVLAMEYLSRLLSQVGESKHFKFHSKCRKMKLNHLVFADDLILFRHGDKDSVTLLLRCLATFASSSGLIANSGKSNIYCCNIDPSVKEDIIQRSGFKEDNLPFKYLGVKVSSKKLTKDDCQALTDKITAKIKTWGCRTLSYSGRTLLVNSVLMTLHSYWANIFVIPKEVLKEVSTICRNFLWDGKAISSRTPLFPGRSSAGLNLREV